MKRLALLLLATLPLAACEASEPLAVDTGPPSFGVVDGGPAFSDWSPAASVGAPVVTPGNWEACPFISKDGLSLYFRKVVWSPVPNWDIFVSHRDSPGEPWGPPVNLGPNVNTLAHELCSFVTIDGHWLYFVSNRSDVGSYGSFDIFVSRRKNKKDPTGWETPMNLGPNINNATWQTGPSIFEGERGRASFYFTSGATGSMDLYVAEMRGKTQFGPATPVAELNTAYDDAHLFVRRRDGLEAIMLSDRPDAAAQGGWDLYVTTRPTASDPWGTPVNLGPLVNSGRNEVRPSISWDGTELYFWTNRLGNPDVFYSMRTRMPH